MELFTWKPEYSVNHESIDNQHKGLIKVINDLFNAMRTQQAEAQTLEILKSLQSYTISHFKTEEALMRQHQYPDLTTHQALHFTFIEQIKSMLHEFESGKKTISIDLLKFLKEWLLNHIVKTDKKYIPYINSDQ